MDDEPRTCSRCGREQPVREFPLRKKGQPRRHSYCRACKAVMQKSWYERNKEIHIANAKVHKRRYYAQCRRIIERAKDRPCADCGERFPPYAMDFDHVRGEKCGDVGYMAGQGVSSAVIEEEIAKCEVVCANCHRDREHRRRKGEAV